MTATLRKRIRYFLRRTDYRFQPIFLLGAPRSGTSWLNTVLGAHPMIASGPEPYAIEAIAAFLKAVDERRERGQGLAHYTDGWEVERCCQDLFQGLFAEYVFPAPYFLATTPYNTDFTAEIERIFPKAPVIHLIRDGRDVALSLVRAHEERGYAYFPSTVEGGAKRWARIKAVLAFGRAHPNRYIELRYEAIVHDTVGEMKRLLEMLKIPVDGDTLATMRQTSGRRLHPSAATDGQGFVGKWRRAFSDADVEAFKHVAGDLLVELGYESDHAWTQGSVST